MKNNQNEFVVVDGLAEHLPHLRDYCECIFNRSIT